MESGVTINEDGVSFEGSEHVWNGIVVNVRKTTELNILNGCVTRELHLSKAVLLKKEKRLALPGAGQACTSASPQRVP